MFNKEWAKTVGKKRFVSHLQKHFPQMDLNLEYDKIVPPKKKATKNTEK